MELVRWLHFFLARFCKNDVDLGLQIAKVVHVQSVLLFSHCNRLQLVVVYMATDTNCNDLHIFILVERKKNQIFLTYSFN